MIGRTTSAAPRWRASAEGDRRATGRAVKRALTLLAGLAIMMGVVGWPAAGVRAHAELEEVVPADGAVVDVAPVEVSLRFTEQVSLSGGGVRVLDDAGAEVGGDPATDGATVRVPLNAGLGDGTYVVSWTVISADSHPIAGTSVFHVGAPSADADSLRQSAEQGVGGGWFLRLLTNAATTVLYAAVLVASGAWWFGRLMARSGPDNDVSAVLAPLVSGTAAVGIIAAVIWLPLRIARLGDGFDALGDGSFVGDTITGPLGAAFAVVIAGLVLVLVGLRRWWIVTALGTVVTLASFGFEGHTRTKDPLWAMVTLDWVHLAAGAAWLGGLTALAVTLRVEPAALRRASAVSHFSSMALWSVAVLAAAGGGMAWLILPGWSAVFGSGYGLALVAKVVLVAVVVAIGAFNRWRLVPTIAGTDGDEAAAERRLSRTLRGELAVLLAVLSTTAVLVSRSPDVSAGGGGDEPVPVNVDIALGEGDGTATIGVTPAVAGQNELTVSLTAQGGEAIDPAEPPVIEFREPALGLGPIAADVHQLVDGGYHAFVDVPFAGNWEVSARVRLDEFSSVSGTTTVTIGD